MQIFMIVVIIALAAGLMWAYRKGYQDAVDNCGASKSELDAYREGYEAAETLFKNGEPDVSVYKRGFEDGFKIGNMKDKQTPLEVTAALREPVKPVPIDPRVKAEQERYQQIIANVGNYAGDERGQKDVK